MVNQIYMYVFAVAFIIALLTTPLANYVAHRVGAIDIPKDGRRMHKEPIPRLGGLAIVLGCMSSIILFATLYDTFPLKELMGIILGAGIIFLLGFFDDIYALGPKFKFAVQIVAALVAVYSGIRVQLVTFPFAKEGILNLGLFSIPLTVIWIVGVTNAVNFIDGLDGLAAGISSIASLSLLFIAIYINQPGAIILTASIAGACMGFLPYNFNPAKIFMGDTGSTFLGYILAVTSIHGLVKSYTAVVIIVPLLVLGLPVFDTAFAMLRRVLDGRPMMQPDRGHIHHRLIDRGLTTVQAVLVLYSIAIFLGIIALILTEGGFTKAVLFLGLIYGFNVFGIMHLKKQID